MRMIDVKCPACDTIKQDVLLRERDAAGEYVYPACAQCGKTVERVHLGVSAGVVDDSVPGGIWVENALCHSDGSPRRFDSKSEMHRFAKERGWENHVVHQGGKGSDKSKNTQRFV